MSLSPAMNMWRSVGQGDVNIPSLSPRRSRLKAIANDYRHEYQHGCGLWTLVSLTQSPGAWRHCPITNSCNVTLTVARVLQWDRPAVVHAAVCRARSWSWPFLAVDWGSDRSDSLQPSSLAPSAGSVASSGVSQLGIVQSQAVAYHS